LAKLARGRIHTKNTKEEKNTEEELGVYVRYLIVKSTHNFSYNYTLSFFVSFVSL